MATVPGRSAVLALCLSLAAGPAWSAAPPPKAAPPAPATGVAIAHKDVGCVVAGRYPVLDACFTPAEGVGRAQVLFRADEKGPWYSVGMTAKGACHSALLPKPTSGLAAFHYFIEVVDRSFTTAQQPESAPERSFVPSVVGSAGECDRRRMMAASQPTGSVVVNVARDAGGKVVQAAASTAGQPASISGFSADGVTFGNPGPAASAPAAAAGAATAGGGIGMTTLLVAGGAVAAGGLVAVAAAGGGEDSPAGPSETSLSGRWSGTVAQGTGMTLVETLEGITCTGRWDLTMDLVHSGNGLSGSGTSVTRSFSCGIDLPVPPVVFAGQGGQGTLSGTASGGNVTFRAGELTYTGTYTNSRMEVRNSTTIEGVALNITIVVTR